MSIRVSCPGCSKTFTAPPLAAGKRGKCPKCGIWLEVPADDTDEYGLSDLPGAAPSIELEDLDDVLRSTAPPQAPSSTRLTDHYAPEPSAEERRRSTKRKSPRTRGRYERATNCVIALDWINFLGVVVMAIIGMVYGVLLLANGDATERDWESCRLLWVAEFYAFWAYVGLSLSVTAFLALLDIESHLASKRR